MKTKLEIKEGQVVWTAEWLTAMASDLDRGREILAHTGSWNPSTEKWSKSS